MIIKSLWESILYVMNDPYFWPSMAITVTIGMFIGSAIYNGCVQQLKKTLLSLAVYSSLIMMVTSQRVVPMLYEGVFRKHHPFSGIATIIWVTIFYLAGMCLGVYVTNRSHKKLKV
jgi:membrane protein DedA with SNARE-associated domain